MFTWEDVSEQVRDLGGPRLECGRHVHPTKGMTILLENGPPARLAEYDGRVWHALRFVPSNARCTLTPLEAVFNRISNHTT